MEKSDVLTEDGTFLYGGGAEREEKSGRRRECEKKRERWGRKRGRRI